LTLVSVVVFIDVMADPWEAPAAAAIERAKSLFPEGQRFMLEEIDRKPGGNWLVTIGFDSISLGKGSVFQNFPLAPQRVYKQFELSPDGKEVIRMIMRHVP
jgi:hypothetical protein